MRKKIISISGFALILIVGAFSLRQPLILKSLERLLLSAFPKDGQTTLHYEKAVWKNGQLNLIGVRLQHPKQSLTLDAVQLKVGLNLKGFALTPHLNLVHPELKFKTSEIDLTRFLTAFVPSKHYLVKVDVSNGVLELENQRFYFAFAEDCLNLSLDPSLLSHPFLQARFQSKGSQLLTQLKMDQVPVAQLLKLIPLLDPDFLRDWPGANGLIEMNGHALFSEEIGIEEFAAVISAQGIELSHPELILAFKASNLKGSLGYRFVPELEEAMVWKKFLASFVLENGNLLVKDKCIFSDLNGKLAITPKQDPSLALSGVLATTSGKLPFHFEGKGALHQDQSYWLEWQVALANEPEPQLCFSYCSPEKESFAVGLEVNKLSPSALSVLQSALGVDLFNGAIQNLHAQGHFSGSIEALKGQLDIDLLTAASHFGSNFETAHLITQHQFKKTKIETSGSVEFQKNGKEPVTIQFGFEMHPFRVKPFSEGWVRSSQISDSFYQPYVGRFLPELELAGDLDLFGTFDGSACELSLQFNELIAKHPLLLLKGAIGEKDKGRAKLLYHFDEKKGALHLPLRSALAFDPKWKLSFEEVDADLDIDFSPEKASYQGKVSKGRVIRETLPLLENLQLTLQDFEISDMETRVPNTTLTIRAPKIGKTIDAEVLSGKKKLLRLHAEKNQELDFTLTIDPSLPLNGEIQGKVASGRLMAASNTLTLGGQPLGLSSIQYSNTGSVDLKTPTFTCSCDLTDQISNLILHTSFGTAYGDGNLKVEWPAPDQSFALLCDLNLLISLPDLQLKTMHPLKIAFSPDLGLIVTDVALRGESDKFELDHAELLFGKKSVHARGVRFVISPSLIHSLVSKGHLPEAIGLWPEGSPLVGFCRIDRSTKKTQIDGVLNSKVDFALAFEEDHARLKLKGESNDLIADLTHDKSWKIDRIKGGLGPVSCDLKGNNQFLKGKLQLEANQLALFSSTFQNMEGQLSLEGNFTPRSFEGTLVARDLSLLGITLKRIEAEGTLLPHSFELKNVNISDDAGEFDAPVARLKDQMIDLPKMEIKNLKLAELSKNYWSVLLSKAQLTDIKGNIKNLASFTGKGTARFSRTTTKKFLWSNEVAQKLQIQPEQLIPAQGEIDFELKSGKCHLKALRDVYGDQKKTQFSLVETPTAGAYFDLSGNLYLDLMVKVSKSRISKRGLALQVRGTVDDPKLSIQ